MINAIAHRDYSIQGRGIEIYVFDDRMELVSPGRLLVTVKVEDLRALHRMHESRNPYITRALREIGYMRELGEGIPRIFRAMAEYDLVQPELLEETDSFKIILYSKSMFSERDEAWLKTYSFIELSKDEQKILLLGMTGKLLTANQIIDILKIIDIDDYRKVLESMLSKGLIYSAVTDNQVGFRKKAYGGNRREVPRFLVRNSLELTQFHGELSEAIAQVTFSGVVDTDSLRRISSKLSKSNPYQRNISMSLKYLGYIGTDRQPLPKMLRLWE